MPGPSQPGHNGTVYGDDDDPPCTPYLSIQVTWRSWLLVIGVLACGMVGMRYPNPNPNPKPNPNPNPKA